MGTWTGPNDKKTNNNTSLPTLKTCSSPRTGLSLHFAMYLYAISNLYLVYICHFSTDFDRDLHFNLSAQLLDLDMVDEFVFECTFRYGFTLIFFTISISYYVSPMFFFF